MRPYPKSLTQVIKIESSESKSRTAMNPDVMRGSSNLGVAHVFKRLRSNAETASAAR